MSEKVPLPRWQVYALRFVLFFAIGMVAATATFSTRALVTAVLMSLAMTGWFYWYERYGSLSQRHMVGYIVVLSILLIVLLGICWYGIERHRHNLELNTRPTISRRWANHI